MRFYNFVPLFLACKRDAVSLFAAAADALEVWCTLCVPTALNRVPFQLILTGLMVMCFAKRRNRYTYLVKFAGGCCLTCVLLCVVITVTTTVVHMNRLQTLHKCDYSSKERACMCLSAIAESPTQDGEAPLFIAPGALVGGGAQPSLSAVAGQHLVRHCQAVHSVYTSAAKPCWYPPA